MSRFWAFAWLRSVHHIVSSGPWLRLANNKRDVVCQGMTCRGRTWHYASKKQAGRWTQYNMLLPEIMSCCFQFEVARTLTGSCDPNGLVGENVWNVDRPRPITMIEFVENRR